MSWQCNEFQVKICENEINHKKKYFLKKEKKRKEKKKMDTCNNPTDRICDSPAMVVRLLG